MDVSPRSDDTANASTITFRSNQVPPEEGTSHTHPLRAKKRFFLSDSDDSDVSITLPLRLNKIPRFRSSPDDSDVIFSPRDRHPLSTDNSGEGDFIVRPHQSQKPFVDPYSDSDNNE